MNKGLKLINTVAHELLNEGLPVTTNNIIDRIWQMSDEKFNEIIDIEVESDIERRKKESFI